MDRYAIDEQRAADLRLVSFTRQLARRWYLVVGAILVAVLTSFVLSSVQTPVYQSAVSFWISLQGTSSAGTTPADLNALTLARLPSYATLAASPNTVTRLKNAANLPSGASDVSVSASAVENQVILVVTCQSSAAATANRVANAYVDLLSSVLSAYERPLAGGASYNVVAQAISTPSGPTAPVKPNKRADLAVGLLGGALLGVGAVWSFNRVQGAYVRGRSVDQPLRPIAAHPVEPPPTGLTRYAETSPERQAYTAEAGNAQPEQYLSHAPDVESNGHSVGEREDPEPAEAITVEYQDLKHY